MGCLLVIGATASVSQAATVYYYPVPGDYATTLGVVRIPAAGYYYNVPIQAVPAAGYLAAPPEVRYLSSPTPSRVMVHNRYDDEPDHDWQFRGG